MMSLGAAIGARLLSTRAIEDLVSDRVYEGHALPTTPYPHVTYQVLSTEYEQHMGGATGLARSTVQVDGWSRNAATLRKLGRAIAGTFSGFGGVLGDFDAAVHEVVARDFPQNPTDGSGRPILRVSVDVTLTHSVPDPVHGGS